MTRRSIGVLALIAVVVTTAACTRRGEPPTRRDDPAASRALPAALSREQLDLYIAVRARALQRSEDTLARLERGEITPVAALEEIASADRRAAMLLGVPWRRYTLIREEVSRTISEQRRREDSRLLAMELERSLEELREQHRHARDAATREFVQAQILGLKLQLERLALEEELPPEEVAKREMLDQVRAELAMQAGRQERMQRRMRELLQAHGLGTLELPTEPTPVPDEGP